LRICIYAFNDAVQDLAGKDREAIGASAGGIRGERDWPGLCFLGHDVPTDLQKGDFGAQGKDLEKKQGPVEQCWRFHLPWIE